MNVQQGPPLTNHTFGLCRSRIWPETNRPLPISTRMANESSLSILQRAQWGARKSLPAEPIGEGWFKLSVAYRGVGLHRDVEQWLSRVAEENAREGGKSGRAKPAGAE